MKTAEPKIIYLQIGEDADVEDMKAEDYETNAITWCWDKINDNDIKYISANEIISKIDETINKMQEEDKSNPMKDYSFADFVVKIRKQALTELKQWMEKE